MATERLRSRLAELPLPASGDAALDERRLRELLVQPPSPTASVLHPVGSSRLAPPLPTRCATVAQACWQERLQLPQPWTGDTVLRDIVSHLASGVKTDALLDARAFPAACQLLGEASGHQCTIGSPIRQSAKLSREPNK